MNRKIYIIILFVSAAWTLFIFLIPVFDSFGGFWSKIADFGYVFYSTTCHQLDERSFWVFGGKVAVCSRCSSAYAAFLLSAILYPYIKGLGNRNLPSLFLLAGALILLGADVLLDLTGVLNNTFITRTLTGGIIGFVLPFYLIPGTINFFNEIFVRKKEHK